MKILYLSSSSIGILICGHSILLKDQFSFSDKENYLKDQTFEGVEINHSVGLLGTSLIFSGLNPISFFRSTSLYQQGIMLLR